MAYEYKWAANQMKLARAIATVKDRIKAGEKVDDIEEAVKTQYVKYLGQVLELDEVVETKEEDAPKASKTRAPKAPKDDK
jgi:hypothetical protein